MTAPTVTKFGGTSVEDAARLSSTCVVKEEQAREAVSRLYAALLE
jgi:aspartokinase